MQNFKMKTEEYFADEVTDIKHKCVILLNYLVIAELDNAKLREEIEMLTESC